MFAKPEWFASTTTRRFYPARPAGWLYAAAWTATIVVPVTILASRGLFFPEAWIWALSVAGLLWWDIRGVRRQLARAKRPAAADEHVMYIGE